MLIPDGHLSLHTYIPLTGVFVPAAALTAREIRSNVSACKLSLF